eukprot:265816_1
MVSNCCSLFLSIISIFIHSSFSQLVNQDIHCPTNHSECFIQCSSYRSCALSTIFCNNSTRCNIICSQKESCVFTTIYHTYFNHHIQIDCLFFDSCKHLAVRFDDTNSNSYINYNYNKFSNRSLVLNSLNISSSPSMILYDIATFSEYTINCLSDSSCESMEIEINEINSVSNYKINSLNLNMNIYCVGIQSCMHMILSVSDNWNSNTSQVWQWDSFTISLFCNNSKSCQDVSVNTQYLKINSRGSNSSFADLYVVCANVDEACVFMDVICPDLIPFNTMYGYLYHTKKCHIHLNDSYHNHISIFSKHGMNTIDLQCNDADERICDGIILYCTEYSNYLYYCDMEYNYLNNNWFCNNYDNLYVFNTNYSYGCDEYIWLNDVAIIHTSKIPHYTNQTSLSCKKYNPSLSLAECYIYCDAPYSCKVHYVYCNDVSLKCHFECSGLQSCKKDQSPKSIYLECSTTPGSICSAVINPQLLQSDYGKFYTNYYVNAKERNYVDFQISHNLIAYIYDYGMSYASFKILNSDDLLHWTDQHDVRSDWRIINMANINTNESYEAQMPLSVDILCDRCYTDWFTIAGYDNNKNISVELECIECSGTDFNFWSITSFEFHCYESCHQALLTFTDSNININCYDHSSCDASSIFLKMSNYSSYIDNTYEYNLNLFNVSSDIKIHSLYGFNQLEINYNFSQEPDMKFYCGLPDYFNQYDNFESIDEIECLKSNPIYESTAVALFEHQFSGQNLTSQITYCSPYQSCAMSQIYCIGDECILHCNGRYSCVYAEIYANYYIRDIKYTQKRLKIYCQNWGACHYLQIFANDIDYVEVNCLNTNSCPRTRIYYSNALNPAKGLNLTCFDITKTELVIPTNDRYYTSCRDLWIYCPFTNCHINIEKALYVNPWDINIFYAKGFNELNLNCQFNPLTNQSTCYDVQYSCNLINVNNSNAVNGEYLYHSTFNRYNGDCIGECCDYVFSYAPTVSPTIAPTVSPSTAPTFPPTSSPTTAPTRSPTIFIFDEYFNATFYIMIDDNSTDITDIKLNNINNTIVEIKEALEYGYLGASSTGKSYDSYSVIIKNLSFRMDRIDVTTQIFVSLGFVKAFVAFTVHNFDFDNNVANRLEKEWDVSSVYFNVYNLSIVQYKESLIYVKELTDYNYNIGTIAFISFTICIWMIGILSLLHTKGKLKCMDKMAGIKPCDDERYMSIIRYGAQTLDLYSDAAFCWELYVFSDTLRDADLTVIRILYTLSFIFFLVPFTINLIVAVIFQKFMGRKLSGFTQNWFNKYSRLFSILVIVSGSVSATLQLVNSSMFGNSFFHSGFSRYELSEMNKFKLLFNVLIENMPQFMIQLFYLNYFKGDIISFTFIVSTCSSIISILSSIMEYFLKRQNTPTFQTKFNIKIVLVTQQQSELQFVQQLHGITEKSYSKSKIEVRDINVKKLHKRGNLRKAIKKNVAKCVCKLSDNFELLYFYQQIDGLTLHGLCSSDDCNKLHELFLKHKQELEKIVKKIYKINGKIQMKNKTDALLAKKYWRVDFIVFDENGCNMLMDNQAIELAEMNPDNKSFRIKNTEKNDGILKSFDIKHQKQRTETVVVEKYED